MADGHPVPDHLVEPRLTIEETAFLAAWQELDTDRAWGMSGPGSIPFASIDRYADRYGIREIDEFEMLRDAVRAMDAEYLTFCAEEAAKQKQS
jgi:hypothetical protein